MGTLIGIGIALVITLILFAIINPIVKNNRLGIDLQCEITLRPGETLINAMLVSWKHKSFYWSRHSIPMGTLHITDQRLVFTADTGQRVNFELEKADITGVSDAGLFTRVHTRDGKDYLLGTSWKKELKGFLKQMGVSA